MKILMKILFILMVFLTNINIVLAEDFKFSNQYEVEIIESLEKEIESIPYNKMVDYILNFNYDLKNHKNKMYSVSIIKELSYKLCKEHQFYTMNEPKVSEFIKENEYNEIYDDENILKKIKTWILLRPGLMELESKNSVQEQNEEYEKYLKRRNDLFERIINNNKAYAPILAYLPLIDGAELNYKEFPNEFIKFEEKLNNLIKNYPGTEFASYAELELASNYDDKGEPQKAIEELEKLMAKTDNFFSGAGDFYSDIAGELLTLYKERADKEKMKYYMKKINPIVKNYSEIISKCNEYLEN